MSAASSQYDTITLGNGVGDTVNLFAGGNDRITLGNGAGGTGFTGNAGGSIVSSAASGGGGGAGGEVTIISSVADCLLWEGWR